LQDAFPPLEGDRGRKSIFYSVTENNFTYETATIQVKKLWGHKQN